MLEKAYNFYKCRHCGRDVAVDVRGLYAPMDRCERAVSETVMPRHIERAPILLVNDTKI